MYGLGPPQEWGVMDVGVPRGALLRQPTGRVATVPQSDAGATVSFSPLH